MRSPTAIQINHEGHFLYIYIRDKCTHYCVGGNISAGFRTNEALCLLSGADPGFQVRGGVLKKIASSGGRREKFWGISCEKSRFYAYIGSDPRDLSVLPLEISLLSEVRVPFTG
jgi:hypothetical protein